MAMQMNEKMRNDILNLAGSLREEVARFLCELTRIPSPSCQEEQVIGSGPDVVDAEHRIVLRDARAALRLRAAIRSRPPTLGAELPAVSKVKVPELPSPV